MTTITSEEVLSDDMPHIFCKAGENCKICAPPYWMPFCDPSKEMPPEDALRIASSAFPDYEWRLSKNKKYLQMRATYSNVINDEFVESKGDWISESRTRWSLQQAYQLGIAEGERRERAKSVPDYVLSLVRFMCKTWHEIDQWAYANCVGEALSRYPVIQGTGNQIKLIRISEQPFNSDDVRKSVEYVINSDLRARGDKGAG